MSAGLIFILLIVACAAFDLDKLDCESKNNEILCQNIKLSNDQLNEIQSKQDSFELSEGTNITFENSDIGTLNANFLKRFPNCIDLTLSNVNFILDSSEILNDHPLKSINIIECKISGVKNSALLKNLKNLEHFGLINSELDYKVLEKNFFGDNAAIKTLDINNGNLEKVEDDAFSGMENVEHIDFADFDVLSFNEKLFENKNNLKFLKLRGNKLKKIPKYNLPKLENLQLHINEIHEISKSDFESYKTLKKLDLGKNGIEKLSEDVFDTLENLEELCLANNEIENISKDNFKNLKHLKKVNLKGNKIKQTDVKDLDIEVDLSNQKGA